MIRDGIGIVGFIAIVYGVTISFGFGVACIIGGAILLTLAVIGAIRK
jgi:hypothetical protein